MSNSGINANSPNYNIQDFGKLANLKDNNTNVIVKDGQVKTRATNFVSKALYKLFTPKDVRISRNKLAGAEFKRLLEGRFTTLPKSANNLLNLSIQGGKPLTARNIFCINREIAQHVRDNPMPTRATVANQATTPTTATTQAKEPTKTHTVEGLKSALTSLASSVSKETSIAKIVSDVNDKLSEYLSSVNPKNDSRVAVKVLVDASKLIADLDMSPASKGCLERAITSKLSVFSTDIMRENKIAAPTETASQDKVGQVAAGQTKPTTHGTEGLKTALTALASSIPKSSNIGVFMNELNKGLEAFISSANPSGDKKLTFEILQDAKKLLPELDINPKFQDSLSSMLSSRSKVFASVILKEAVKSEPSLQAINSESLVKTMGEVKDSFQKGINPGISISEFNKKLDEFVQTANPSGDKKLTFAIIQKAQDELGKIVDDPEQKKLIGNSLSFRNASLAVFIVQEEIKASSAGKNPAQPTT